MAGRVFDFEAYGWLSHPEFAGIGGWSLTDTGRRENEQRLADELTEAGLRDGFAKVTGEHRPTRPADHSIRGFMMAVGVPLARSE